MALNSISLLPIKSINISSSSSSSCYGALSPLQPPQKSFKIVCQIERSNNTEVKKWKAIVSTALAAAVITFSSNMTAMADLNKFEAETRGEFGIGSAAQFGSADLKLVFFFFKISSIFQAFNFLGLKQFFCFFLLICRKTVHTNENFR